MLTNVKKFFLNNPLLFIWKLIWFVPAVLAAILFAVVVVIFHLSFTAGCDFLEEVF